MLGGDRQTLQRAEGAALKFACDRQNEESTPSAGGSHSVRQFESVGAHCFQSLTQLLLERAQLVPTEQSKLRQNIVAVGVRVVAFLRRNSARQTFQHERELACCGSTA